MTEQTTSVPQFPPPPRTEEERLSRQVLELQDLLTQAERDAARALRERDLMRERVSEPYGCTHCGEAKRSHGRRYVIGAGTHAWERPTDEQVKARMLARRAARQPLEPEQPAHGKLWQLLEWSFWGAGMGDVFRMPLADAMVAAVPAETVTQAEEIMAEFIERRKIEKTGVTIYQEQRDELEQLRAELAEYEPLNPQQCPTGLHADWLVDSEHTHACPWCRIAELEAELAAAKDRHKENLRHADEHLRAMNAELQRYADGTEAPVLWSVYNKMHGRALRAENTAKKLAADQPALEQVRVIVRRLAAHAVGFQDVLDDSDRGPWARTVGVDIAALSDALRPNDTRAALPWAHVMPDDDLHGFLNDLVSAAIDRWRSDPDIPDRDILTNIEKVCANWRAPGQGHRSDDETGDGR